MAYLFNFGINLYFFVFFVGLIGLFFALHASCMLKYFRILKLLKSFIGYQNLTLIFRKK